MTSEVALGVYRRLDNRFQGQGDQSPLALGLHHRRRVALHDVFDNWADIRVVDWGDTNDSHSHEYVELTLVAAAASAGIQYAIVPGLQWLGTKLAEKTVETALGELVKGVIAKLRPKQESKDLLDVLIRLPDGTVIAVDPPDRAATNQVQFADGSVGASSI